MVARRDTRLSQAPPVKLGCNGWVAQVLVSDGLLRDDLGLIDELDPRWVIGAGTPVEFVTGAGDRRPERGLVAEERYRVRAPKGDERVQPWHGLVARRFGRLVGQPHAFAGMAPARTG